MAISLQIVLPTTENRNVGILTESQLKQMIAESVKKVLKEWDSDDDFIGHGELDSI